MPGAALTPPTRLEPWLGREMAGLDQVERTWTRGTWEEDPHPSEILRTRSRWSHRLGQLYDEMIEKDADLAGLVEKRADAVLGLPRRIWPADGSPAAAEAADLCRHALGEIPAFATPLRHLLGSRPRGVAHEEILWEQRTRGPWTGAWLPVDLIDRPLWRFAYRRGRLHVRRPQGDPIPAPPGKFVTLAHGTKDTPWGRPLLDHVYWYWFIKKHGWKFWAVFVEKWAQPTSVTRYRGRRGADGEQTDREMQAKALELARAFQTEQAVAVPEGIVVELLEATRSGAVSYQDFIHACTRGMSLVFLGEINTSGLRPGTGAYASDKVADEIRADKVRLDAHDLAATALRDQLLRPLVRLNLGPDAPVPRLEIDTLELEDREQRADGIAAALDRGQPVPRWYFYATLQVPEPQDGEEVVEPAAATAQATPPSQPPTEPPALPPADAPSTPARHAAALLRARLQTTGDATAARRESEARAAHVDRLADAFRAPLLDHYRRLHDLLLEGWDLGLAEDGRLLTFVADRLDVTTPAERLLAAQAHAVGLGFQDLLADGLPLRTLRTAPDGRLDLPLRRPLAAASTDLSKHDTWSTALDYWTDLLELAKALFTQLEDAQRRFAFTVAGVDHAALLRDVHQLLREALAEGLSRKDFRARLADLYERRGLTPTSDHHADLVLTNNLRQAQAAVRYAQTVGNPDAHRQLPYLQFVNLDDTRVRHRPQHNHRTLGGHVFAITHPIWQTWWTPAGHGCRCAVRTIHRLAAQRLQLTGAEPTGPWPLDDLSGAPVLPDPGFRGAPDLAARVRDELEPRLRRHLTAAKREAGTTGGDDLLSALRRILTTLLGFDPFDAFNTSPREIAA